MTCRIRELCPTLVRKSTAYSKEARDEVPTAAPFPPGTGPQESTPEFDAEMTAWGALNEELKAAGAWVAAAGLELDDAATTLRAPKGERVLSDGPFAETKELLFSYYVIDVTDLDAAIEWAARMPNAEYGSVEIRPLAAVEQNT